MSAQGPSGGEGHRLSHKPGLDGIRALAVAAVLAYHAGLPWARGGFLGVDAFFVLSGYLITSLLLAEWRSRDNIGLIAFWSRRARRLLPALFLMLIGVAFYSVFFASQLELGKIRGDAIATICYVANWRPVFTGASYFDQFSLPSPLRHTWSLAIEEQYYLVWPLLLLFLLRVRRTSPGRLLAVTLAMAAASALLMGVLFQPGHDPSRVYYGTDTRAQSLLVGAALAMLLLRTGPVQGALARPLLQTGGLTCALFVGILWSVTSENSTLLYRGGFLILALAVAVVIAAAVQPKPGPIGRVLSLPPLRALGLISYGVYLWHWPIYLVLTPARTGLTGWDGYELFAVRVLATLAIATASYHLLEMPIRRGAFRQHKVAWAFAPTGAMALAVVFVLATRGAASPVAHVAAQAIPQLGPAADLASTRVMLVGDSEGSSMLPGLEELGGQQNLLIKDVTTAGCGFLDVDEAPDPYVPAPEMPLTKEQADRCKDWRKTWPAELAAFRPDIVIWVFGSWDSYSLGVNGQLLESGSPEWHDYLLKGLQKDLDLFAANGEKFVLLTYPFYAPPLWGLLPNGSELEQEARQRITNVNELYRQFAAQHPDQVTLVDMNRFVCPEGKFTDIVIDGVRLRADGGHFTEAGSLVVARWLVPQIVDVTGRSAALGPRP